MIYMFKMVGSIYQFLEIKGFWLLYRELTVIKDFLLLKNHRNR